MARRFFTGLGSVRIRPIRELPRLESKSHGARLPDNLRKLRAQVPAYQDAEDTGRRPIPPEVRSEKPCMLGKGKPGLRSCHAELIFLGERMAPEYGVPPGAYLQFCTKPKERGLVVPVKSPKEASDLAARYCKCLGKEKGQEARAACARSAGGEQAKKKRRRRGF